MEIFDNHQKTLLIACGVAAFGFIEPSVKSIY